jgi:diguanylate cyclase (GGDEF)-like protein/PAS domain S-box-containing protein
VVSGPERHSALPHVSVRALVNATSDLVVTVGPDLRVRAAYGRVDRIWLGPVDELIGREALSLVHPDDRAFAASELALFMSGGEPESGDEPLTARVVGADGVARWAALEAGELDDPEHGIVIVVRNVDARVRAEQALQRNETTLRAMLEHAPSVVEIVDTDGVIRWAGPGSAQARGLPPDAVVGADSGRVLHPDDVPEARRWFARVAAEPGRSERLLTRIIAGDGRVLWIDGTLTNRCDDPDIGGIVANYHDVTELVTSRQVRDRLGRVVERTADLVVLIDGRDGTAVEANPAARAFWGLAEDDDLRGDEWRHALTPRSLDELERIVEPATRQRGSWSGELDAVGADGRQVTFSVHVERHGDAGAANWAVVARDISERKAFEARLAHEATHDALTGLPNRALLLDRLEHALARAARTDQRVAVIFCDLDHFKVVNDSLGHGAGDEVLRAAAERIATAVRPGDTVARFGGDELVVVCEDLARPSDAMAIADRIGPALGDPVEVGGAEVFVTVSCGVAVSRPGATDAEQLLGDADAAMYRAKSGGRARVARFDRSMREEAVARLDLEAALRRALDRHELRVRYQPLVELDGGRVVAVEALARWEHPERGLLLPADWIALAEETGLIVPVGAWMLEQACRQLQRWRATVPGADDLEITVNVSGRQLAQPSFPGQVERALSVTGLPPDRLGLELTESVLMDDVERSAVALAGLKALGVQVVIDDFGTGYSSLSYLRRFPVDQLKVDRSFVDGVGVEHDDTAIVALIVALARTLGLRSVAEGVETELQRDELRRLGVDRAQGYLLGRPQPAEAVTDLLTATPTRSERSDRARPPRAR